MTEGQHRWLRNSWLISNTNRKVHRSGSEDGLVSRDTATQPKQAETTRKAKAQLELKLVRNERKGFFKYTGSQRKGKENMVTKDAFCTFRLIHTTPFSPVFTGKFCFKACQVLEPSCRNKALPTAEVDWVSENLGPLKPTGWTRRHWGSWLMALWDHATASLLHHHHHQWWFC